MQTVSLAGVEEVRALLRSGQPDLLVDGHEPEKRGFFPVSLVSNIWRGTGRWAVTDRDHASTT